MTRAYQGLRGSLHPDTAQARLDYWQGVDHARAAATAADEIVGAIGAAVDFRRTTGTVDFYFDRLIDAEITFARAQLRERDRETVSAVNSAPPADHSAESPRPAQ